jgi:hypothetical protein
MVFVFVGINHTERLNANLKSCKMNLNKLLDRLRMQGLIQRLIREHGQDVAQQIIADAVEIELVRKTPVRSKLRS